MTAYASSVGLPAASSASRLALASSSSSIHSKNLSIRLAIIAVRSFYASWLESNASNVSIVVGLMQMGQASLTTRTHQTGLLHL